jgi:hypothetical protein
LNLFFDSGALGFKLTTRGHIIPVNIVMQRGQSQHGIVQFIVIYPFNGITSYSIHPTVVHRSKADLLFLQWGSFQGILAWATANDMLVYAGFKTKKVFSK